MNPLNPTLVTYAWVMAAGALGTASRMALSNFFSDRYGPSFPVGTVVVNVTGCFVIGFLAALCSPNGPFLVSPLVRTALLIGFLGGYTTFSSFSLQTITLLQDGEWLYAGLNVGLSVALCLLGTWLGIQGAALLGVK